MHVTCPACAARYRIDDAKVRGRTARMRCKTCATEWMASAETSASSPPPEKMAEPSRAARVRTGKDRERRDLFATQHTEDVPVSSARPSSRPAPSYGARNENSVLFTVESLKAASIPPPKPVVETPAWTAGSVGASAPPAPVVEDHEGIIDLKALSGSVAPRALPNVFPGDTSRSFAQEVEAARGGGDPAVVAHLKGLVKTANPRIVGAVLAGVAAIVVLGFGLSAVFGGDVAHKLASVDQAQARVSAVAAMVATRADQAASAKMVLASMPVSDTKPTPAAKPATKAKGGYVWRASSSSQTTTMASTPKPRKSADTCGCHGDFNCILRCSAKGK